MYNGQNGEIRQAESLVFSANKEESHSNPPGEEAVRAITRNLERGQITITFAEHDDPEIVDAVLGMLLQNLPK